MYIYIETATKLLLSALGCLTGPGHRSIGAHRRQCGAVWCLLQEQARGVDGYRPN